MHLSLPLDHYAVFLDVDGTLVSIAPRPGDIYFDVQLCQLLGALHHATRGATALISGRDIQDLQRLAQAVSVTLIGGHGSDIYHASNQEKWQAPIDALCHAQITQRVQDWGLSYPQLHIETKSHGIAIHFRQARHLQPQIEQFLQHLLVQYPMYTMQQGKMVLEVRLSNINKGGAIAQLLSRPPFFCKCPIMIGDDLTDESAFQVVNQRGGLSFKVGSFSEPSCATYRVQDVKAVRILLEQWLETHN